MPVVRMRPVAAVALAASLLLPVAPAAGVRAGAPAAGSTAVASSQALAVAADRKVAATLTVERTNLTTGKVRLVVRSNARSVKVSYRTAAGAKRSLTRKLKQGSGQITLPAGAQAIRLRTKATSRLTASPWFRLPANTGGSPTPEPSESESSPGLDDPPTTAETEVVTLVNQARSVARTCGTTPFPAAPALAVNEVLTVSARGHSQDMALHGYFSHTGLDGSQPWDRMQAAGYVYRTAGENIAAGQPTPGEVVRAWLDSPGHCSNIMNGSYTEIGVGYAYTASLPYRHYWTQNFGSR